MRRLLDEIVGNIKTGGAQGPEALHEAVLSETRKLVDFTNRTEPEDLLNADEVEKIRTIDEAADEARRKIFGDSANVIIGHIHERISQLNQLEKAVRQQAAENEREASKLRLVPVRNAIDAVTKTVDAIKDAKDALSAADPGEVAVKSKIESVLQAIAALDKAARETFVSS